MYKIINLLNRVLKNSGQINIETGKWHCWVSNQGGHNLFQLFKKVGANNKQFDELKQYVGDFYYTDKEKNDSKERTVVLPNEFKTLWNGEDSIVKRHALSYLYKRGITDSDILKYNIGYCVEGLYTNRIIIPSYDEKGDLNFFVGRDFYNSKMKYRNTPTTKNVIGFELFINWDEPIILCEGVFDAMAFKRNAIPLFGKTIMSNLQKKIINNRVQTIYLALDNDAIKDAIKISDNFINNGIDVKMMKFKEKDPSEIGFENLLRLIDKTQKTKFSDIMKMKLKGF